MSRHLGMTSDMKIRSDFAEHVRSHVRPRRDKLAVLRDALCREEAKRRALVDHIREQECVIADLQVQLERFIAREAELYVKGTYTMGVGEYDPVAKTMTYRLSEKTRKQRGLP